MVQQVHDEDRRTCFIDLPSQSHNTAILGRKFYLVFLARTSGRVALKKSRGLGMDHRNS